MDPFTYQDFDGLLPSGGARSFTGSRPPPLVRPGDAAARGRSAVEVAVLMGLFGRGAQVLSPGMNPRRNKLSGQAKSPNVMVLGGSPCGGCGVLTVRSGDDYRCVNCGTVAGKSSFEPWLRVKDKRFARMATRVVGHPKLERRWWNRRAMGITRLYMPGQGIGKGRPAKLFSDRLAEVLS